MIKLLKSLEKRYNGKFEKINEEVYRANGYLYLRVGMTKDEVNSSIEMVKLLHKIHNYPDIEIVEEDSFGEGFYTIYLIIGA